jgi:magnesium-transporting ATPase (P-type)
MTESCLNAVQLIYINLIMDILGALALASTRPQTDIAKYAAGQEKLMTPFMYRQIFGVTLFQTLIMMVIMFGGKSIFNLSYSASTQTIDASTAGTHKMQHFTLIWNTFVFLQVFNLINCRDVSATKMHGFAGLLRNFLTWFIILIIAGVQVVSCFTFLGRPIFEASNDITARQFLICIVAASSVLLANALLKAIPSRWIAKMPTLDESKAIGGESKLMSAYDTQSKAKAFTKKAAPQVVD